MKETDYVGVCAALNSCKDNTYCLLLLIQETTKIGSYFHISCLVDERNLFGIMNRA